MVSPVFKAGYQVNELQAVAPDGESVAFTSAGGFDHPLAGFPLGMAYIAHREPRGWSTASLQPPAGSALDYSSDLLYVLAAETVGANVGQSAYSGNEYELLVHDGTTPELLENWEVYGGEKLEQLNGQPIGPTEEGASADLCHVVIGRVEALRLPALNSTEQLYDVARGCGGGQPSVGVIGLNNKEKVINHDCRIELGVGPHYGSPHQAQEINRYAISRDGSEIFFTTNVESGKPACDTGAVQLFARLGGTTTIEVSRPIGPACVEVPCEKPTTRASAFFSGASDDGSRVYFTTEAQLTGEGEGNNLYMATIGCPATAPSECASAEKRVTSLVQVSRDPLASGGEVQGVASVARDGARIYFVARGVLTEAVNAQGLAARKGADNMYVYDADLQTVTFVADLCSGPRRSGVIIDSSCPSDLEAGGTRSDVSLWSSAAPEAQSAGPNGEFLVFSTYAQLLREDTDDARDVYEYDASTGVLERVSIGEGGYAANGNVNGIVNDAVIAAAHLGGAEAKDYQQQEMGRRAVSEDGSRIVFRTAGALSSRATNGVADVYEWHEGHVSLISSGTAEEGDENAMITQSGQDVFFTTAAGIAPDDRDGVQDIYDARLGEGFPPIAAEAAPCEGDGCQGPLTSPVPVMVPGSAVYAAGENLPPPKKVVAPRKAVPKHTKGKSKAKRRRAKRARGRALNRRRHVL